MIYSGIITYEESDIAFQFDEKKLSLFPSFELFKKMTMHKSENGSWYMSEKKPLADGWLEGKVNGQPVVIHFFFDPLGYGTIQKNIFECEIFIYVNKFIKYNNYPAFPFKDISLKYKSQQLHRFLGLIPQYEISSDLSNGLCGKITCDTRNVDLVSSGIVDGTQISIKPSHSCRWGGTVFSFTPEILVKVSEIRDEKHLLKIYDTIQLFVKFAFMRQDINSDSFIIEIGMAEKGEIFSNDQIICDDNIEDCNSIWIDSIPWSILYNHAIDTFSQIYNNNWYFENLPKTKKDRMVVNDIVISKEAAAFEHEFFINYPDGLPIHSEKRIQAEKEVESELNPLLENAHGKKREIYKGFVSHIRNDALADKIEFCLNEYEPCIRWLKSKLASNFSSEEIANICADIRNDIDHGNNILSIDHDVANVYGILRSLVYAMQLKRFGYETDDINNAIRCLFYVRGIAP